jgi:glucosamine--fructose-6-phosphate aminotransferase (isomerizing)
MCGIVAYLGPNDALPIIMNGLEKLEYRGYDSAGVALFEGESVKNGQVRVARAVGKLGELRTQLAKITDRAPAHIGLGHTRWATHGRPSETNAHPHTAGRVSLIHNGIIENYLELRADLEKSGSVFKSETDTEILAHLLNQFLEKGQAPFEALKSVVREIRGSYAFLAFDAKQPDRLLVAKNATPIIIGIGKGEMLVASDIPPLLAHTRQITVLEDGDVAEITLDGIKIENQGKLVQRKIETVTWDPITAQRGGYKHYMLKEINEQPRAVGDTLLARFEHATGQVTFDELHVSNADFKQIRRIVFVACGTAWHAALLGKFYIESLAKIPCEVDYASEFRYRSPVLDRETLVIAVSQSGETADTISAIDLASKHARTLAVCNVLGSSLTRKVEGVVYTHAGPEISVASTKAFTTQVVALRLLAMFLAQKRGVLDGKRSLQLLQELLELPNVMEQALKVDAEVQKIAKRFSTARDYLFLGRGISFPVALEGALKLKEISYIHAEGYPAGEMKHGPIALIDEKMPVVVIMHRSDVLFEKSLSSLREVEARGGQIIVITDAESIGETSKLVAAEVKLPFHADSLSPLILTIPLQLLAYHTAVLNGTDVDQPRNLAKSVTVE